VTRLHELLSVLGVLGVWHLLNALVLGWAWCSRQLIPADRRIVRYLMLTFLVTASVVGCVIFELWRMR